MNSSSLASTHAPHATAAEYDRLRHELDALMHVPHKDRAAIERTMAQLDQAHADCKSAYLAMHEYGGVVAGAALRPERVSPTKPHQRATGHAPGAGHHTQEGPAQPGELPAHWATT